MGRAYLLLTIFLLIAGCSAIHGRDNTSNSMSANDFHEKDPHDVSGLFVPTFREIFDEVQVLSPSNEVLFTYNPFELVDIDNDIATRAIGLTERAEHVSVINAAISGAFAAGYYEAGKGEIADPRIQQEIKKLRISIPIKVTSLHKGVGDLYIVAVLNKDKIVAAAEIQVDIKSGQRIPRSFMYAHDLLDKLPSLTSDSSNAISRQAAFKVASQHASVSSSEQLERVFIVTNKGGPIFGHVFWRVKNAQNNFFVNSTQGKVFKATGGYSIQSSTDRLPGSEVVRLEEVR